MNASSIVAHPSPSSFSHAMAEVAAQALRARGYAIRFHDLYAERFDPIQPASEIDNRASSDPLVERHCAELAESDLILIFHPNWWGQPPAILKGWIDRVFRLGVAYDYPPGVGYEGVPVGLLRASAARVFNTSNTPEERERAVFGDPLQATWQRCVFDFCGVRRFERRVFGPMASSTPADRAGWLADVARVVASCL